MFYLQWANGPDSSLRAQREGSEEVLALEPKGAVPQRVPHALVV